MGAYDRRDYKNRARNIYVKSSINPTLDHSYRPVLSVCSVVSYRSNPKGILVSDKEADPYAWFIADVSRRRREKARKNRLMGSDEAWIIDEGHSFSLLRHSTNPVVCKGNYRANTSSPEYMRSNLITTSGAIDADSMARMPYLFEGVNAARRVAGPRAVVPSWNPAEYNTQIFANVAPTRPELNLSVALGELLREGPPRAILFGTWERQVKQFRDATKRNRIQTSLYQDATRTFSDLVKGSADEYLNYMFGIQPIVSDIAKYVVTLMSLTDVLRDYHTNAGKGVRRDVELKHEGHSAFFAPSEVAENITGFTRSHYPAMAGEASSSTSDSMSNISSTRQTSINMSMTETIWFSGSFSYYLPVPDGFWGQVESFTSDWNRLLGAPVSWEALWELMRWSWLLDWFFGIQTAIRAAETIANDNLVVNYGYLMRKVVMTTTVETKVTNLLPLLGEIKTVRTIYETESLSRTRANPFGYSLTIPTALSSWQVSLLAAIGVTRGGK